jgi:hypothetical protein
MALTNKYIIRNATNMLMYTEDHTIPFEDRWTPDFNKAFMWDTKALAEAEIEAETTHGWELFNIFEVIIKS